MRYICVVFLLLGCNVAERGCRVDEEFREEYFNCLNIVAVAALDTTGSFVILESEVIQAINCLDSITNHQNSMRFEEVGFAVYESTDRFQTDLTAWLKWYESNKCSYTMAMADDLLERKRDKFPNYNDTRVMDSLSRIWYQYRGDSIKFKDSLSIIATGLYWPPKHPEIGFVRSEN